MIFAWGNARVQAGFLNGFEFGNTFLKFLDVLIKTLEFLPHRFTTHDQFGVSHVFEVGHEFRHEFQKINRFQVLSGGVEQLQDLRIPKGFVMKPTHGAGTGGFAVLRSGFAVGFEEVMNRAFEGFLGCTGWHERPCPKVRFMVKKGLEGVKSVSGFGVHRSIKRGIRSSFKSECPSSACLCVQVSVIFETCSSDHILNAKKQLAIL